MLAMSTFLVCASTFVIALIAEEIQTKAASTLWFMKESCATLLGAQAFVAPIDIDLGQRVEWVNLSKKKKKKGAAPVVLSFAFVFMLAQVLKIKLK